MSNHEQPTPSHPKSDVRNTAGKDKQTPQGSARTTSAVDLEEFCEKHYEKLLSIMADKYEYEQRKKEKLEEVKARLDFGGTRKNSTRAQELAYSESRTMSPRRHSRSHSPRQSSSVFTRLKREKSRSPRHDHKNKTRRESTVFKRLGSRGRSVSAYSNRRQESSRYTESHSESEDSEGGTGSLSHESRRPVSKMTTSPNFGSEDPEDHLKIFQAAAKTERWVMPTWCHMFNSTLTGNDRVWFDDLPPESINNYDDLREAFLKNYLQQKKCIRDPIVLHNIKQRDGESTEDSIQRYKSESGNVKGAPECMRISGFMNRITNPELIKRFHEKIPKTVDEMMQVATSFLQGQEAASNQERKKAPPAWKHQEGGHRQNFRKGGGFHSQHKQEKRPDRFTLLTKTPKEIMALEKGKFKTPPPMTTLVEKQNANKFCEFHEEVGYNTNECNHLRKQIVDMLKAGKLSHIIRELKQSNGKDQQKKKGETSGKEKPQAILMIQSRQKVIRQKITQSFSPNPEISFPSLRDDEGAEGPLIIEAEIGGHQVHRMCIDGGSSFEILYEHCFNRLRPEIKNQMVPATTSLIGFSGEIKWPLGQITLLVKIGDDEHSTLAWMDFMVVRSTSPHNGIIGRPGLRKIQAVPSTTHGMIKFPVTGGILTLRSSKIIPIECAMVSGPEDQPLPVNKVKEERVKVAINPEHPEQTVMIGSNLTEKARVKMCNLLQRSLDVFAWTPADMTGVPRHIAEHRLNVREGCQPIRRKKKGQAAERNIAINDEVSIKIARQGRRLLASITKNAKGRAELYGKVISLNRFLAKSAEKSLPFFKTLKKCTKKSDFLWTEEAESAFRQMKELYCQYHDHRALKKKRNSRALRGSEVNTLSWKNSFVLALVHAAKVKKAKNIVQRTSVIDFFGKDPKEEDRDVRKGRRTLPGPMDLVHRRVILCRRMRSGSATNNEAEYEALIAGLRIAEKIDKIKYLEKVKTLASAFQEFSTKQVPRNGNKKADALSKMASTSFAHLSKQVLVEELKEKSMNEIEVLVVVEEEGDSWMTPIHEYLTDETLPAEQKKARAIKQEVRKFLLHHGIPIQEIFSRPMASMCRTLTSKLRLAGNTRGLMQHACWHTIRHFQSFKDWLLLADDA
ncbi:reverse transcriptase domain-containing protein [Tanacetum coccineum]